MMLDVSTRLVVIVGGGPVAARKARGLLDAGATRVRCVALSFCDEMPTGIERVPEPYRAAHLDSAGLAFAATDRPEVNEAVVRDARARGVLVNRVDADEGEPGDFATPAKLRRGEVSVMVSAASPALAAMIRDGIAERFDARWERMAGAMRELRPTIRRAVSDVAARRQLFRELASEEALNVLHANGVEGLRRWLRGRHPEWLHD
jgi:precorrin-2 dehydrogenase/sirohydrochlorin ferrochelatase